MDAISNPTTSSFLPTSSFLQSNPKDSPNLLNLHRPITQPKQLSQYFTLLPAKPNLNPNPNPPAPPLPLLNLSPPLKPRPHTPPQQTLTHRRAATGYAAAIADAASCDGALAAASRDARRLMRRVGAVLADPAVGDDRKAAAVADAAGGGGMYGKLAALVRMLVRKGKVGLVLEVMEEFGRICGHLSRAATAAEVVVVVAAAAERRMAESELAGVARAVQRKCGAEKVKVRHLFASQ